MSSFSIGILPKDLHHQQLFTPRSSNFHKIAQSNQFQKQHQKDTQFNTKHHKHGKRVKLRMEPLLIRFSQPQPNWELSNSRTRPAGRLPQCQSVLSLLMVLQLLTPQILIPNLANTLNSTSSRPKERTISLLPSLTPGGPIHQHIGINGLPLPASSRRVTRMFPPPPSQLISNTLVARLQKVQLLFKMPLILKF